MLITPPPPLRSGVLGKWPKLFGAPFPSSRRPHGGVHYVEEKSEFHPGSGKKKTMTKKFLETKNPERRTRLNYIFVGCDSHDKTLVNKIAENREAAERKVFAATQSGQRKMIEYLQKRSQAAGGAKV